MEHMMEHCREAGYQARANGDPYAPGANAVVIHYLEGSQVGSGRLQQLARAFKHGWDLHTDEELDALGILTKH